MHGIYTYLPLFTINLTKCIANVDKYTSGSTEQITGSPPTSSFVLAEWTFLGAAKKPKRSGNAKTRPILGRFLFDLLGRSLGEQY